VNMSKKKTSGKWVSKQYLLDFQLLRLKYMLCLFVLINVESTT
jgi:hypothetical protein